MGSTGSNSNWRIDNAPAWDYMGDGDDRTDINTAYFDGLSGMKVDTNLNDWVDDANEYTTSEQTALQRYVSNSSVNTKLRSDPNYRDAEVAALDRIIAGHTLDKDTTLFSGLSNSSIGNANFDTIKTGDTFTIPTFLSTSPDPIYAGGYTLSSSNSNPTVLEIRTRKGDHVAKTYYDNVYGTEGVMVRNTSFRVVGTKRGSVNGGSVRVIVVEVV